VYGVSVVCFNESWPTELYTLSLHDALPIWTSTSRRCFRWMPSTSCRHSSRGACCRHPELPAHSAARSQAHSPDRGPQVFARNARSEEHTSELQSRENLVCRLLLEKKKNKHK